MRKRNILSITAGIALLAVGSCSPIITDPLIVTDNAVGSKVGEASYRLNFFGLPTEKDANVGVAQAAKNGGITKIATVDIRVNPQDKSFTTVVTGE